MPFHTTERPQCKSGVVTKVFERAPDPKNTLVVATLSWTIEFRRCRSRVASEVDPCAMALAAAPNMWAGGGPAAAPDLRFASLVALVKLARNRTPGVGHPLQYPGRGGCGCEKRMGCATDVLS